jgi:hypothetical protein
MAINFVMGLVCHGLEGQTFLNMILLFCATENKGSPGHSNVEPHTYRVFSDKAASSKPPEFPRIVWAISQPYLEIPSEFGN